MSHNGPEIVMVLVSVLTVSFLYLLNKKISNLEFIQNPSEGYAWLTHGLLNILGYSTILLPGYLLFKYTNKINYLNKTGRPFTKIINKCFGSDDENILTTTPTTTIISQQKERTQIQEFLLLIYYFIGLQLSFLSWGILQEKIMTQKYENTNGNIGHFKDSQFLVFVNRILAFFITGTILICRRQPRHRCPLYKYAFCSLSNIMSSWCQYEALKYVSFPHQVLAKAAKVIPVMLMGKIISKTKYEYYEYITAVILSIGMIFFMLDTDDNNKTKTTITTMSGFILLISYIIFDSFTSNWQGKLFKTYNMKPIQMMCCVNLFSCIFTAVSLLQQNSFIKSFNFMLEYPRFIFDCILLTAFSAAGQMFIYSTLATFGPLIFAIITTIRQGLSVLLSCIIYNHKINLLGIFGIILVFLSILLRIYCNFRIKMTRKKQNNLVKVQRI